MCFDLHGMDRDTLMIKKTNKWSIFPQDRSAKLAKNKINQVKSFNTARVVKQMSTLMLKYAIYAFSVEKQLKSVLNIWIVKILLLLW